MWFLLQLAAQQTQQHLDASIPDMLSFLARINVDVCVFYTEKEKKRKREKKERGLKMFPPAGEAFAHAGDPCCWLQRKGLNMRHDREHPAPPWLQDGPLHIPAPCKQQQKKKEEKRRRRRKREKSV
jgi:hypothetical protein